MQINLLSINKTSYTNTYTKIPIIVYTPKRTRVRERCRKIFDDVTQHMIHPPYRKKAVKCPKLKHYIEAKLLSLVHLKNIYSFRYTLSCRSNFAHLRAKYHFHRKVWGHKIVIHSMYFQTAAHVMTRGT